MRPVFEISIDGASASPVLRDRLLSMTVTDEAGLESDALELTFDDRAPRILMPAKSATLRPAIGWERPTPMGLYKVDALRASGPPDTLTIRAKGADMTAALKAPKTRSFEQMTLGQIVERIAAEHGLRSAVAPALAGQPFLHLSQTGESDLNLLTRLAREQGAIAKPAGGFLIFAPRGEGKATTGADLPVVEVKATQLAEWDWEEEGRSEYGSVRAFWRDTGAAERKSVTVGAGEPVFELRHTFASEDAARSAAGGKRGALQRGSAKLSLTLKRGDPRLMAEGRINLIGLRSGVDGLWSVVRATHSLTGSGYATCINVERPEAGA